MKKLTVAALAAVAVAGVAAPAMAQKSVTIVREIDTDRYDPQVGLIDAPGPLWIDVFIRNGFTSDTNAYMVGLLRDVAQAEEATGRDAEAAQHRTMSSNIAAAMNEKSSATIVIGPGATAAAPSVVRAAPASASAARASLTVAKYPSETKTSASARTAS